MLTSIAGRSVIVTGASRGIGKGIAKVFCQNGGKVLLVSRNLDEAEACAEELRHAGGAARGYAADVTKMGDMQLLADTAAAVHGGIDILCANAGIFPQATIEDLSAEDWDHVMATNLKGTFLAIKTCLPYLKKSDQGRLRPATPPITLRSHPGDSAARGRPHILAPSDAPLSTRPSHSKVSGPPTSVLILVHTSAFTALMTVLFLHTKGSVLLAAFAHHSMNTARDIVELGIPTLSEQEARATYLANVALLALSGALALWWLARRWGRVPLPNLEMELASGGVFMRGRPLGADD